ncbi:replication protein [Halomonas elongata]|uniref:replication protein n=1 Tax=Halomonas elongata TaxID=2746 RepID=UPI00186B8082|nr:replication protein [Halomonas elongata]MBW5800656.1 replication protein [Halomonas elongata]
MEDGFVRIATELHQALARSRMTGNERAVVDAVIRFTYGYQRKEARIMGETFSQWTGLDRSDCNSIVSELVRRRILLRAGSRSPIRLNKDYSQWEKPKGASRRVKPKKGERGENRPTGETPPKPPHWGDNRPTGEEIEWGDNGPTEWGENRPTYKDSIDIPPLPSVEGEGPRPESGQGPKPAKPKSAKSGQRPKTKPSQLDLSNLPPGVTVEAVQGFIEHRKALKKPLTQRALNLNINEALRSAERIPELTADQALDETVLAGWQGVKADWLARRLGSQQRQGSGMNQAERLHASNQQAIREAVARRQERSGDVGDLLDTEGGHW